MMESLSVSGAVSHCWHKNEGSLLIPRCLKSFVAVCKALFGKYRVSLADNRESILHGKLKFSRELRAIGERHTRTLDASTSLQKDGHTVSKVDFKSVCRGSSQTEIQHEADKVIDEVVAADHKRVFTAVVPDNYRKSNYIGHLKKAKKDIEAFENKIPSMIAVSVPELEKAVPPGTIKQMFLENTKPLTGSGWPTELANFFNSSDSDVDSLPKQSLRVVPLLCELTRRTIENATKLLEMQPEARKAKILSIKAMMDTHVRSPTLDSGLGFDRIDEFSGRDFGEKPDCKAFIQLCLGAAVAETCCGALEGYKEYIGSGTAGSGAISLATVGKHWINTLVVKSTKWNHINLYA